MKYLLTIMLFISSGAFGQGMQMTVFSPGCNCWVNKNVYETGNPPTAITGNAATATTAATLTTPRNINGVSFNGSADITIPAQGLTVSATTATTGTITTAMTSGVQDAFSITPTGACTFNASGGMAGSRMTFIVTTSGISSFTLTWGTNFKPVSTLATGTTTAKIFTVDFLCLADNVSWVETGRTTAH